MGMWGNVQRVLKVWMGRNVLGNKCGRKKLAGVL